MQTYNMTSKTSLLLLMGEITFVGPGEKADTSVHVW